MGDDLKRRAHGLLKRALDRAPAERDAFLLDACGDDRALLAEARALLAAAARAESFLETPALAPGAHDPPPDDEDPLLGRRIGDHTIREAIAAGGMGTVYRAEQDHPRRSVAIKVIRRGIASGEALRRFRYEAEILARLRHPGIAQVYEAHTHDEGLGGVPYFVMEYIPGARPITAYAQEEELDTRARLRLFIEVCDAVQHGHVRGVIHRDLKPANVLVDGQGRVKVIDFGVARLTDADARLTAAQTSAGQLIGTVQYMSPEQCTMDPAELDTRSDVYSLGVILYELVSGKPPYDTGSTVLPEAIRMVREQAPARLSRIDRRLRGDLETIVAKALEKDRAGRYQSASELGADLERFLAGEAISARPRTFVYQLRVFARRNPTLVGAVVALVLVLSAGVVTSTALYLRAEDEARTAREVIAFLNDDLLASIELYGRRGVTRRLPERITIQMLLDAAPKDIDERFGAEPLVAASIHTTLGNAYRSLGSLEVARRHLDAALALRRAARGDEHRETLTSFHNLARLYASEGRLDEAEELLLTLLETRRRALGAKDPDTLGTMNEVALLHLQRGDGHRAEAGLQEVLANRRHVLGAKHPDTLETMHRLALLYEDRGQHERAEALFERVMEGRLESPGPTHQLTLATMRDLAWFYRKQERYAEAEPLFERCLEVSRSVLGESHAWTATAVFELAGLYYWLGRKDEMEPLFERHIADLRPAQRDTAYALTYSLNNLGVIYRWQHRDEEAEPLFREALALRRYTLEPDHPDLFMSMNNLASLLVDDGRYEEAEPLATDAVAGAMKVAAPREDHIGGYMSVRGAALAGLGRYEEAEVVLLESMRRLTAALGPEHERTLDAVRYTAGLYEAWGRWDDAAEWRARLPD